MQPFEQDGDAFPYGGDVLVGRALFKAQAVDGTQTFEMGELTGNADDQCVPLTKLRLLFENVTQ